MTSWRSWSELLQAPHPIIHFMKPFLETYGGQTLAQLIGMQATHRIDSLVLAIEQAIEQSMVTRPALDLTEAELTVLSVEALEREVNNGGYEQFFINSSSEYTKAIVPALERIGCPLVAAITGDAIGALGLPEDFSPDMVSDHASELPDGVEEHLEMCDARYFRNKEDIEGQLFAYIQRNQHDIRLPIPG